MSQAVTSLLATAVAAIAVLGGLLIWHFVRRARLIREGLSSPRPVRWPIVEPDVPKPTSTTTTTTNTPNQDPERRES